MNSPSIGCRLVTLGDLRLESPAGELLLRRRRKELALLAFIACQPGPVRREALADMFWGEAGESNARQSLRQALASIRKAIPELLATDDESVTLPPGSLALDVAEFERAAATNAADAVDRWTGDFLPNAEDIGAEPFRTWLDAERARLGSKLQALLQRLACSAESPAHEVTWVERWAALFPLDERAHLHLLAALGRAGRAEEALERHAVFVARSNAAESCELPAAIRDVVESLHRTPVRAAGTGPGAAAFLTPDLVGRDAILTALKAAWNDAAGPSGVVMLLEGEAGSGRTRLVAELVRYIERTGRLLHLQTPRNCDGETLAPVRRFLHPLAGAPGLAATPPWALAEIGAAVPEIAEGRALPERPGGGDLAAAVEAAIAAVADEVRVLIVVDDAEALCTEVRPIAAALIRRPPAGALVVLTAEPGRLMEAEWGRAFRESPVARRIKLQPLDPNQVEVMVASMIPIAAADRQRLASLLMAEAEGNPLRITDCISAFADAGVLSMDQNGMWRLSKGRGPASLPLPPSLVRTRLERLTPAARDVIGAMADQTRVAGRELLDVTRLAEPELEEALGELVSRRLVRPIRDSSSYELASDGVRAVVLASRSSEAATAPPVRSRRWRLAASGVAALGIAAAGLAARSALPAATTAEPGRVIVFALEDLTGAPDSAGIGRRAAEAIIQGIGRIGSARAVPLVATGAAPGSPVESIRKAALSAGASLAVVGSFQRSTDSVIFAARIVEVESGEVRTVTRDAVAPAGRAADGMSALAESVLGALSARLDRRIAAAAAAGSVPPSYAAYRAFAEGLDFLYAREGERANSAFFAAYALDTTFALPLIYAAFSHDGQGRFSVVDSLVRVLEPRRTGMTPYEQATLDFLRQVPSTDLAARYATARRAAALAPGSMMAGYYFPRAAIGLNRPREAVEALDAVDPEQDEVAGMPGYWSMLSMALHMAGDYERQLTMGRAVETRFPKDTRGLNYQVRALAALGEVDSLDAILSRSFLVSRAEGWDALGLSLHVLAFDELRAHGHGARAEAVLERAVAYYEAAPDSLRDVPRQRLEMAKALLRVGRLADARRTAGTLILEEGLSREVLIAAHAVIGVAAAAAGDLDAAAAEDAWLAGAAGRYTFGAHTAARARIAATLGDREKAVRLLQQAVGEGHPYDNNKHLDFELQQLRGYPPFEEWLRPKG